MGAGASVSAEQLAELDDQQKTELVAQLEQIRIERFAHIRDRVLGEAWRLVQPRLTAGTN